MSKLIGTGARLGLGLQPRVEVEADIFDVAGGVEAHEMLAVALHLVK